MLKEDYFINEDTCAILSDFDNYGNEISIVYECADKFMVTKPPNKIVKDSYNYRGFDFKGAESGARHILKKKKLVPVVYSIKPGIILIRCSTPNKRGIIWLVNSQIREIEPLGDDLTIVHLFGGHTLTVRMKCSDLQTKRTQSSFLHMTVNERLNINNIKLFLYDKYKGISLINEKNYSTYINEAYKKQKKKNNEHPSNEEE